MLPSRYGTHCLLSPVEKTYVLFLVRLRFYYSKVSLCRRYLERIVDLHFLACSLAVPSGVSFIGDLVCTSLHLIASASERELATYNIHRELTLMPAT